MPASLNGQFTIPPEPPRTDLSRRRDLYPGLWRTVRAEVMEARRILGQPPRQAAFLTEDPEWEAGAAADLEHWGCNPFEED
jgi:hypothetical protein